MTNPQRVGSPPAENVESNRLYRRLSLEHFSVGYFNRTFSCCMGLRFLLGFFSVPKQPRNRLVMPAEITLAHGWVPANWLKVLSQAIPGTVYERSFIFFFFFFFLCVFERFISFLLLS